MRILLLIGFIISLLLFNTCEESNETPRPTVYINSPQDSSTVSGIVMIEGFADDNTGGFSILWVELWVDDIDTGIKEEDDSGLGYFEIEWDTLTYENGPHSIAVRAYAGRKKVMGESDKINLFVNNQS